MKDLCKGEILETWVVMSKDRSASGKKAIHEALGLSQSKTQAKEGDDKVKKKGGRKKHRSVQWVFLKVHQG